MKIISSAAVSASVAAKRKANFWAMSGYKPSVAAKPVAKAVWSKKPVLTGGFDTSLKDYTPKKKLTRAQARAIKSAKASLASEVAKAAKAKRK